MHPRQQIRSARPVTCHSLAQSGDIDGLRVLLHQNPSLINSRNPVMSQTPLQMAAASNQDDAVRFLLEWNGPERADLEATNMFLVALSQYGETALHLAAKNGSTGALKVLLKHNARKEAKALNGMTPLHLAVWSSVRAQDCKAVEVLLEHNADVSLEDNEKLTPLSHLPKSSGNEKLQEMLERQLDLQRRQKAKKALSGSKLKMLELEKELEKIVGLDDLKLQLRKWAKGMLLDEKRRSLGLNVPKRKLPHMAFLGNPGTGKTMIARLLAKLLHMVGVLECDKVVEVQRTDLVGEFVGHTGPKTRKRIREAEGGILFVDEAYRLIPAQKADDKDYGVEALEEIMSVMDSGKVVVIFAGYAEPMKRVIASNEGFCRRVTRFFHFPDFSTEELAEMIHLKLKEQHEDSPTFGLKLEPGCTAGAIAELLDRKTTEKQRSEMNGGLVWPLLANAKDHLDYRLDLDCCDSDELVSITLEDLEAGSNNNNGGGWHSRYRISASSGTSSSENSSCIVEERESACSGPGGRSIIGGAQSLYPKRRGESGRHSGGGRDLQAGDSILQVLEIWNISSV
ncbi:hypothetical protein SELMODRAFT_407995 [Selaginella moellendorffii]|uniref:AAA+ ATPase domain-containing protein n=1 Tax=Selaginella moellendorffii TaxID=88036 RepID=D8R6V4_SELML|nr:hypothetical protein SELMODRAFT_407995 [Selaginella moellendorffii]